MEEGFTSIMPQVLPPVVHFQPCPFSAGDEICQDDNIAVCGGVGGNHARLSLGIWDGEGPGCQDSPSYICSKSERRNGK